MKRLAKKAPGRTAWNLESQDAGSGTQSYTVSEPPGTLGGWLLFYRLEILSEREDR